MTALLAAALALALAALACGCRRERAAAVTLARTRHEIRGPLCSALLGLEPLAAGEHAARIAAIEHELRRAALMLEELAGGPGRPRAMGGSRGRQRPSRPASAAVDLGALVAGARESWQALAGAHGARLEVDAPGGLWARGEPLRLAQACANLVANAAEHGGGAVGVRVRALGDAVRVEVTDDGPGLPASVDALVAAARRRTGRRGHGLGVAAAVAARYGGRLAAGPSPRGARLVLELPAAAAADRAAGP
jgi:signal transduction histidine kinase